MIKSIILTTLLLFQSAGLSTAHAETPPIARYGADYPYEIYKRPIFLRFPEQYGTARTVTVEGAYVDCFKTMKRAITVYFYDRNGEGYNKPDAYAFFEDLRKVAATMNYDGIPLAAMLAQAYTEGGAGKQGVYRMSNNLFGIRAGANWNGFVYARDLKKTFVDYSAAVAHGGKDLFRAYDSISESMEDYIRLIKGSDLYKGALGKSAKGYLKHLTKHGYGETAMVKIWLNVIKIFKLKGE